MSPVSAPGEAEDMLEGEGWPGWSRRQGNEQRVVGGVVFAGQALASAARGAFAPRRHGLSSWGGFVG